MSVSFTVHRLAAVLFVLAPAVSQSQSQSPRPPGAPGVTAKLDCARAATDVTHPPSEAALNSALSLMTPGRCGAEAPSALAAAWSAVEGENLDQLRGATARFADRRLLHHMVSIAMDAARPKAVRLEAMAVLVSYADARAFVRFRRDQPPAAVFIGDILDFRSAAGPQPITPGDRASVPSLLARIAAASSDVEVRGAASALSEQLDRRLRRARSEK